MKKKLLIGFMVPIIFLVMVGFISYEKAKEGLSENYEAAAETAINTQMEYLDFGLSLIYADTVQMKLDSDLSSLVGGTYKNDASKAASVVNKTLSNIKVKATSNAFIERMYIVPKNDNALISSAESGGTNARKGFYEEWAATEEGKGFLDANGEKVWIGEHCELDRLTGYPADDYIMSYVGVFSNRAAAMVVDISAEAVRNSLSTVEVGAGEALAFVTQDGRELVIEDESSPLGITFSEQPFFQEAVAGEENSGTRYVEYNGREYFFIYSTSKKTGASLAYLVPKERITGSADSIRDITLIMVLIACAAALLIGTVISVDISTRMSRITKKLQKASEGDLTVQMKIKGRDEFAVLSQNVMHMITNMRDLIMKVEGIVGVVAEAVHNVENVSGDAEESSGRITESLGEINQGMALQSEDLQSCLGQMDELSGSIKMIARDIRLAGESSSMTKQIVADSVATMNELTRQSSQTTQVTGLVKEDIRKLQEKTVMINKFIEVINDIASQTNLLSLNASIEAARAGEAGRGFAVVAEEIRNLADGSIAAADEIRKVVAEITAQTKDTARTAQQAESIVEEQAATVEKTKEDFQNISQCTEQLIANIDTITEYVSGMDRKRHETLKALSNISAVSEEAAASSGEVCNIALGQKKIVDELQKASDNLKQKMDELEEALAIFTLSE